MQTLTNLIIPITIVVSLIVGIKQNIRLYKIIKLDKSYVKRY